MMTGSTRTALVAVWAGFMPLLIMVAAIWFIMRLPTQWSGSVALWWITIIGTAIVGSAAMFYLPSTPLRLRIVVFITSTIIASAVLFYLLPYMICIFFGCV